MKLEIVASRNQGRYAYSIQCQNGIIKSLVVKKLNTDLWYGDDIESDVEWLFNYNAPLFFVV